MSPPRTKAGGDKSRTDDNPKPPLHIGRVHCNHCSSVMDCMPIKAQNEDLVKLSCMLAAGARRLGGKVFAS